MVEHRQLNFRVSQCVFRRTKTMSQNFENEGVWLAAGVRTPFAKIDSALSALDAIELSLPVARAMLNVGSKPIRPDLVVWGTVAPNLGYSNIASEVLIDADQDQTIPAFATAMACSTSMIAAFEAASMLGTGGRDLALVGGVESMSRIQIGLDQRLSDWLRRFFSARSLGQRLETFSELKFRDIKLYIPSVTNRSTGKSMGEHTEEMAKDWDIAREDQDKLALKSHEHAVAAQTAGFFESLITPVDDIAADSLPRTDTSLERLAALKPVFDQTSGRGTLTAGNSSPLTDGAAGVWVATEAGHSRLPDEIPRVRLLDWEIASIDLRKEGLLMAPAYAIPRLLARHRLAYEDIDLWEIHEAFAAQVLCNIAALESDEFLTEKVGVEPQFGNFPWQRLNPNGGSVSIGHPFGATGARILSQATKELAAMPPGSRAVVSVCADGGLGTVALLQAA